MQISAAVFLHMAAKLRENPSHFKNQLENSIIMQVTAGVFLQTTAKLREKQGPFRNLFFPKD